MTAKYFAMFQIIGYQTFRSYLKEWGIFLSLVQITPFDIFVP